MLTNVIFLYLCFRASLIYINNCPTRCNTKQSIYYSASPLYMFWVSTTPIMSTQNCNYSLRCWSYFLCNYLPPTWPSLATLEGGSCKVPEAVVTVLCTPDDGCGWHPKHVRWTCWIINRLLCVASCWTIININVIVFLINIVTGIIALEIFVLVLLSDTLLSIMALKKSWLTIRGVNLKNTLNSTSRNSAHIGCCNFSQRKMNTSWDEDFLFLGYDAASLDERYPNFRRIMFRHADHSKWGNCAPSEVPKLIIQWSCIMYQKNRILNSLPWRTENKQVIRLSDMNCLTFWRRNYFFKF